MPRSLAFIILLSIAVLGPHSAFAQGRPACAGGAPATGSAEVVLGEVSLLLPNDAIALQSGMLVCPGDLIRTGETGRVEIRFAAQNTTVGITGNSTMRIPGNPGAADVVLETGVLRFISSVTGSFAVETRQVNAGIDGTEAVIATTGAGGATLVVMTEGTVALSTAQGTVQTVSDGDVVLADASGIAPANAQNTPAQFAALVANPEGAADWAIHYPAVLLVDDATSPGIAEALRLLEAGKPDQAEAALAKLGTSETAPPDVLALRAVIAAGRGRREDASAFAASAVARAPNLGAAHLAYSYARQANGDLGGAGEAAERAVAVADSDPFAWARLAEILLTQGDRLAALDAAEISLQRGKTALAQTVRGFALLAAQDVVAARTAFGLAIALDNGDPLPRLGIGLLMIRDGELAAGRRELELAAALDPRRASLRTWLGRGYLAEGAMDKALTQFDLAAARDPDDPTPFLFAATAKALENRPVEALSDIRAAEARGQGRSTLRSERGLGEDRASRAAVLGRVLDDLGFTEHARDEAARATETDPTHPDAQRVLAELYGGDDGLVLARTSALLRSQLLAGPSLEPIDPALAEADLAILSPTGPARTSFVEYSPFFEGDGVSLQTSGFGGTQDTYGDLVSFTAKADNAAIGFGQYHYETDGYRINNDVRHDVLTVQGKLAVTPELSFFTELRHRSSVEGDRNLEFDLNDVNSSVAIEQTRNLGRLGFHAKAGANSDVIGVLSFLDVDFDIFVDVSGLTSDVRTSTTGVDVQLQHIYDYGPFSVQWGMAYSNAETDTLTKITQDFGFGFIIDSPPTQRRDSADHLTGYAYATYRAKDWLPETVLDFTLGGSFDRYTDTIDAGFERSSANPKAGIRVNYANRVNFRAAFTQTVSPDTFFDQKIEPVTVAGIAQFRPEIPGSRVRQLAGGVEIAALPWLSFGAEAARRWIESPDFDSTTADVDETEFVLYTNATFGKRLSGSLKFSHEDVDSNFQTDLQDFKLTKVGGDLRYFHPSGFFASAGLQYVWHEFAFPAAGGEDDFLLADFTVGYRLPRQRGVISVEIKNALDEQFMFQEKPIRFLAASAPVDPLFARDFTVMARATLNF